MGRRKKEPESVHRENIASAAQRLFSQKGIESTTMDEIAKDAGYSKATLYVYFTNKEELIGFLVLKSMNILHSLIRTALDGPGTAKERYHRICLALVDFQEQYPLYFTLALGEINVNLEKEGSLPVEREIFDVGEQINSEIVQFIRSGMDSGELILTLPVLQTVFLFWASLSGVIQMAENKQAYLEKTMSLTKKQFLLDGFLSLYRMIAKEGPK